MWREPTDQEKQILSLVEIHDGLEDFGEAYADALRDFHENAIALIALWVKQGRITAADLLGADVLDFPGREQVRDYLVGLQGRMSEFGKSLAEKEIDKLSLTDMRIGSNT